ncbi:MAG: hypothetical protein SGBAC_009291 [Bacillariaceae sp.]
MIAGELISGEVLLDVPLYTQVNRETETLLLTEEPKFLVQDDRSGFRRQLMRTNGDKTVLAVRVEASNSQLSASEDELSQAVFGGPSDFVNLKSQFYACSHGKLNFQKRPDLNGVTTNIRNGVVTIRVSLPVSVGHPIIVNAVSEILIREFGITQSRIADHVLYCLPKGVFSGVAYAIMNRGLSVYNDKLATSVSVQMHEVGAPKTYQLEWFRDKSISYTPGKGAWSYDQTFTIASMVDYQSTRDYVIVQIVQPNLRLNYYLGLNAAKGFNSDVKAGQNQVLVFEKPWVDGTESHRIADLSTGQTYTIQNFNGVNGDKLVISVLSIDLPSGGNSEALVNVQFDQGNRSPTRRPTRPPTRPPTRMPTPRPTPRPTRATPRPTPIQVSIGRNPTIGDNTNGGNNFDGCGISMDPCENTSTCCTGFSCRRVSSDDANFDKVCRAVAKTDKDKLPRVNVNWWDRRRLKGDGSVSFHNQELEDEMR